MPKGLRKTETMLLCFMVMVALTSVFLPFSAPYRWPRSNSIKVFFVLPIYVEVVNMVKNGIVLEQKNRSKMSLMTLYLVQNF